MDHIPIMVEEICASIPSEVQRVFYGTAGHGGHSKAMLETGLGHNKNIQLVAVDRDSNMIKRLQKTFADDAHVTVVNDCYDNVTNILQDQQRESTDFILLDIGINREHIADAERGFSIKKA